MRQVTKKVTNLRLSPEQIATPPVWRRLSTGDIGKGCRRSIPMRVGNSRTPEVGEDSRWEEGGPCVETSGWIRESNPLKCGLEYQEAVPGFVLPLRWHSACVVEPFKLPSSVCT